MGRGRAKAKQTKVARELKYSTHGTDLEALQRELAGQNGEARPAEAVDSDTAEYADEYDDYGDWTNERR